MIVGIGIDSVDIIRFAQWHSFSIKTLSKIFHPQEIDYCLLIQSKSAERFAVRFAAKEAFLKAVSHYSVEQLSLATVCKNVRISHDPNGIPQLTVEWANLSRYLTIQSSALQRLHVSLTHSKTTATALVILEKFN